MSSGLNHQLSVRANRHKDDRERYPCGGPKPLRPQAALAAQAISLTIAQGLAARRYISTFEKTQRDGHGERRIMAQQAHQAAKATLTPQQVAITDMALIRGQDVALVAMKAGRSVEDMLALLNTACDQLAAHYRDVDRQEAA